MRRGGINPFDFMPTPTDLFRMTPFSLMRRITDEMDRAYHELTTNPRNAATWAPAVEVSERDGKYVVRAELPGVKPADVKLEMTDEALVIEGERKSENQETETKGGVHLTERQYGRFYRSIPVPEGVNIEEARARFENGVLEVTVPVREQRTRRREIPIEAPSSAASSGKAA
jgi:HSP20 family protein